jgi:lysophospholipase L1-like esterase
MNIIRFIPSLLAIACIGFSSVHAEDPMAPITPNNQKAPVHVACVGDSITQGSKKADYPTMLQKLLGDAWVVSNFGHSGMTLMKSGNMSYWTSPRYQQALASKPDVVIIKLGTNDAKPQNWAKKEDFIKDYKELIASFQKLESKPRIYLCRPCPVFEKGNYAIKPENIAEQLPLIDALAKELNLGLIDMHAPLADKPDMIPDRVHPNGDGYAVMAATAYKALTGKTAPEQAK